jgi:uncharacterized integral membrane protein (TIGR00698 family)
MHLSAKTVFFLGLILCATGMISPPVALAVGIGYGLAFAHPFAAESKHLSKFLLQASVVALGFGMDLHQVLKAGETGFLYTAISISVAMLLGLGLGRLFGVRNTAAFLIASGTAICGGSAIAAVGPIVEADEQEMAVSLSTVFVLNSAALLIFPLVGWALQLSQQQFGLWAALAIHDTSSVVGATAKYGAAALMVGTTVKLARALWIVPLSFATAAVKKSKGRIQAPWFIGLFCVAAVVSTYAPGLEAVTKPLSQLGRVGLTATLFLIGTGISRATLRRVGWRPFLQAIALWAVVAVGSLVLITRGHIRF